MGVAWSTYTQYPKPSFYSRLHEAITQVMYQITDGIEDKLLIVLANVIFGSFFAGEQQYRDQDIVESPLQSVLIAISKRQLASARAISLKKHPIKVVIVFQLAASSQ